MKLSEMLISLLLFGVLCTGPILFYGTAIAGVGTKYGVTVTNSVNTTPFLIVDQMITQSNSIQSAVGNMTTSTNPVTDFVNLLVAGKGVLDLFLGMIGVLTSMINEFLGILQFSPWISEAVITIAMVIIVVKILSILLGKDV